MTLDFERVDITSSENRWIKLARSLHRRRNRYRERAILVEGVRPLREALNQNSSIRVVLLSDDVEHNDPMAHLAGEFAEQGVTVYRVEARAFTAAADTDSPQGILAILPLPDSVISLPAGGSALFLILDRLRDPGNLGTLLRAAQGAGVHGVFVGPECVDPYAPKVVRAAMGAHFHVPLQQLDWESLPEPLRECGIYSADMDAEIGYDEVDWQQPSAIVVGNETTGVSPAARQKARARVGIPLASNLESLNAAIAGSVILFEAARQRRKG